MGFFYFDESIQERAGLIMGAFIYSDEDLTPRVYGALSELGFAPKTDEFKSSAYMHNNPNLLTLRERLTDILCSTKIGVVIIPSTIRVKLGDEALIGLTKIIDANNLYASAHEIYFDTGIKASQAEQQKFIIRFPASRLNLEQDSKIVAGLQIADLAAHLLGRMLIADMGVLKKTIRAGENTPFAPDEQLEHEYVIWSQLRRSFFIAPEAIDPDSEYQDGFLMFNMADYGLHIAASCSDELRNISRERFETCFLGCIL